MAFVITKGPGRYFARCGTGPICWVPDAKRANTFETAESASPAINRYGGIVVEVP